VVEAVLDRAAGQLALAVIADANAKLARQRNTVASIVRKQQIVAARSSAGATMKPADSRSA
jgi:hypothetical protein